MNTVDKYRELVERLHARTMSKKLQWQMENSEPYTQIGNNQVFLSESRDMNGEPSEVVTIRRYDGEIIEAFDDLALGSQVPSDEKHPTYWRMMNALRETAMRQALGADDALDEILDELGDDLPF